MQERRPHHNDSVVTEVGCAERARTSSYSNHGAHSAPYQMN